MKLKSWMLKALILGAVFFIAAFLVKPVGVSTQFSVFTGIIHSIINPNVITEDENRETGYSSSNEYYDKSEGKLAKNIKNPWNYDFVFVLAIPLGAYAMHMLMKKRKDEESFEVPDIGLVEKTNIQNPNVWKVYVPSFIGGFLLLYGARMADGCTSGHMISGMMQGSISGYVFAATVFAVAIPTAVLVGMRQKNKGGK